MKITDILASGPTYSFEFFPPKTPAAAEALTNALAELEPLGPSFASVTYGAGGGTREMTHDIVTGLHRDTNVVPMAHLTCVCHSRAELVDIATRYRERGHRQHPGAGRRSTQGLGPPTRRAATRDRVGPVGARGRRFLDRGGRVPGAAPEVSRSPRPTAPGPPRSWPKRISRSRSSSSTPTTTSSWSARCTISGSTSR